MKTTVIMLALAVLGLPTSALARGHSPAAISAYFDAAAVPAYQADAPPPVRHRHHSARHQPRRHITAHRGPAVAAPAKAAVIAPRPAAAPPAPSQAAEEPMQANLSALGYYAYSEIIPEKPALVALAEFKDVAIGTAREEIRRAADAFGVDPNFMRTVAKIESDFNPTERTGSYIGLFQLSRYEFNKYGAGSITSARDNAIAAAFKFVVEAAEFEDATGKQPSFSDLYLIHQQGEQGAAEHVSHPERIAWRSMCATDEGKQKGESWCKKAIWGNTLPTIKAAWKSVENLTSGAFVDMWRQRVDKFAGKKDDQVASAPPRPHYAAVKKRRGRHYAKI